MEHRATRYSANMMMLDMEVFQPIDFLMRTAGEHFRDEDPAGYVQHLCQVLRDVYTLASKKLRTQLNYQKCYYNLKLEENHYEVGDFVYRLNGATKLGESKMLKPIWVGHLVVTAVINPVLFCAKDRKKEYVLHHDRLKPCEDRVVPLWLRRMRHNMLDLDTTIAYDEAEQDEEMPSSTPLDTSSSSLFTEDESSEAVETQDSESIPLTPLSCESTDSDNIGEGISQEPGPQLSAPFVSSFADTKVKEATDLFFWEEELGLDKLFKETVHVHAQKPQVPQGKPLSQKESSPMKKLPKTKKRENFPVETVSRSGRRRKTPSYLQDYQC